MANKINKILSILIIVVVVGFLASSIYSYYQYTNNPDLYMVQSAPWYTSIQITGIFALIVVAIAIAIKLVIKKRIKTSNL